MLFFHETKTPHRSFLLETKKPMNIHLIKQLTRMSIIFQTIDLQNYHFTLVNKKFSTHFNDMEFPIEFKLFSLAIHSDKNLIFFSGRKQNQPIINQCIRGYNIIFIYNFFIIEIDTAVANQPFCFPFTRLKTYLS